MSTKPPVLALHGFTGSGEDFKEFSPFCHTLGAWHCPDLPGHGSSSEFGCSPEAIVEFISKEAGPLLPCSTHGQSSNAKSTDNKDPSSLPPSNILLGYSMGARAALQHACAYPKSWDALILISPNPGIETANQRAERLKVDEKLASRIERDGVKNFIEFWQSTPMIRSQQRIRDDWRAAMQVSRARHTEAGLARSLREFGQGDCPNLWSKLSTLKMPVLLISGEEDIKYTRIAERMFDKLSNPHSKNTFWIIDNAGHMPHLEQPETTADVINEFVARLGAQT